MATLSSETDQKLPAALGGGTGSPEGRACSPGRGLLACRDQGGFGAEWTRLPVCLLAGEGRRWRELRQKQRNKIGSASTRSAEPQTQTLSLPQRGTRYPQTGARGDPERRLVPDGVSSAQTFPGDSVAAGPRGHSEQSNVCPNRGNSRSFPSFPDSRSTVRRRTAQSAPPRDTQDIDP